MGDRPVRVPAGGAPLLASGPVHIEGDTAELPPDTALWHGREEG
jgi:alpha-glucosidase